MFNEKIHNEDKSDKSYTVCLNMIVKNESNIITRLLTSVTPFIDCYCICDTGSTDNTTEVIQNYFQEKNIHGKIIREPFQNFCYNRNFALNAAVGMSDYVLLLDADMVLEVNNMNMDIKSSLGKAYAYNLLQGNDSFYYKNIRVVKNDGQSKYIGVTHEYISLPNNHTLIDIPKHQLFIRDIGDGGSKSDKLERDIRLLTDGIKDEPNNVRYHFYLANTYFDKGDYENAIDFYKKRIEMKGWDQEVWYSYYRMGISHKKIGNDAEAIYSWMNGYEYLPQRLEGLYEIIHYYRNLSKHKLCFQFYTIANDILHKNSNIDGYLFLHKDVYSFLLMYEYTIIAYYNGIKKIEDEVMIVFNNSTSKHKRIVYSLLKNMKFYHWTLTPSKIISFDNKLDIPINNECIYFESSSSCLIQKPNYNNYNNYNRLSNKPKYCMNLRYVNYYILPNGQYINCDKHIITLNKYIEMDENFTIIHEKWFESDFNHKKYIGIEDIRLFYESKSDTVLFIGTGLHTNNKIGIMYGDYETNSNVLLSSELTSSFSNESVEKNWVYVHYKNETHIIYKWNPLQICKLDEERNQILLRETKKMPNIFSHVRGSSCGFVYANEIWFVTHIVSYESPRHYYHMIAIFDENMNILRYSAPFQFEGEAIEYCLSIVVEDDRVLMNYSTWDRSSKIGIYDKKYIDSITKYK
jgi:tetratricopeptide (TPR) repeat protein